MGDRRVCVHCGGKWPKHLPGCSTIIPDRPVLPGSRKAEVGEGSELPAEAAPGGPWDEAMRLAPLDDDELADLAGDGTEP